MMNIQPKIIRRSLSIMIKHNDPVRKETGICYMKKEKSTTWLEKNFYTAR